jgi:hypothetical protein
MPTDVLQQSDVTISIFKPSSEQLSFTVAFHLRYDAAARERQLTRQRTYRAQEMPHSTIRKEPLELAP